MTASPPSSAKAAWSRSIIPAIYLRTGREVAIQALCRAFQRSLRARSPRHKIRGPNLGAISPPLQSAVGFPETGPERLTTRLDRSCRVGQRSLIAGGNSPFHQRCCSRENRPPGGWSATRTKLRGLSLVRVARQPPTVTKNTSLGDKGSRQMGQFPTFR